MALGAKDLIARVRALAFDASPGKQLIDTDILGYLDAAVQYYQVKCATDGRDLFINPISITLVKNQEMYRWARFVSRIVMVERSDLDPAIPANPLTFHDKYSINLGWVRNIPQIDNYFLRNTQLGVAPLPTSGKLNVYHAGSPPPLHYGTVSAAAGTSVTFTSPPTRGNLINLDNAYNEMPLIVTDSTERVAEPNVISGYVAATRVATVGFTWATTPTAASSIYQLCPPIPEQFHMMVAFQAARMAKMSLEDNVDDFTVMERDFMSTFLSYISKSQVQAPKMVRMYGYGY